MKPTIDREQLLERIEWQTRQYDQYVHQLKLGLEWMAQQGLEQFGREPDYTDPIIPRTHTDAVASAINGLQYGYANLPFQHLITSAADLAESKQMLLALDAWLAEQPEEIRDAILAASLAAKAKRDETATAQAAKRLAEIESQCQFSVHVGGRGVGFRQCQNKASGTRQVGAKTYRCCWRHQKEGTPHH